MLVASRVRDTSAFADRQLNVYSARCIVMASGVSAWWSAASTSKRVTRLVPKLLHWKSVLATLPLAEVRANLSKLVDEVVRTNERIEVTRQGRRAAVILGADDYDSIMETLARLRQPDRRSPKQPDP